MGRVTINASVSVPDGAGFEARTGTGHLVHADAAPPFGHDGAARPTELVLAGLAACTAVDVVSILRKKRQRAERYEVHAEADAADGAPAVFLHVVVEHRVHGRVDQAALHRSIELSATRYCAVSHMLSRSVEIEHRYVLERPGEEPVRGVVAIIGPSTPLPPRGARR